MERPKIVKCLKCNNQIETLLMIEELTRPSVGTRGFSLNLRAGGENDMKSWEPHVVLMDPSDDEIFHNAERISELLEAEEVDDLGYHEDVWWELQRIYFQCESCGWQGQLPDLIEIEDDLEGLLNQVLNIARGR